jgi:hypothetical protein
MGIVSMLAWLVGHAPLERSLELILRRLDI